jgi:tetratricopeptide (TPR) repeat protein
MLNFARLALLLGTGCLVPGVSVLAAADLESTFQSLKDAVAKKDAAQVKTLAVQTSAMARAASAAPAPQAEDEKDAWTKGVEYARGVDTYTEYALYATALQAEPAVSLDLFSTLEQQNPKSKYLGEGFGAYLMALQKTGAAAKIPAATEHILVNFPDNVDALLVTAESAFAAKQTDRALEYATRLTAALGKDKPEDFSASDWESKRAVGLPSGYWIAGVVQADQKQYSEADKNLRAAMPLLSGNETRKAYALFYLGMADYQLGKTAKNKAQVLEAAKFSRDAAAIKSPVAQQALKNATVMRDDAAKMK